MKGLIIVGIIGIASIVNAQQIYSEDFSVDPGFTSLAPQYAYWDSSQKNYYVATRDDLNNKYWAYSPNIGEFDPSKSDVEIRFDVLIEKQNWGTYPGVRFYNVVPNMDIGSAGDQDVVFYVLNGNADNARERFDICTRDSTNNLTCLHTPQWSVQDGVWYSIDINTKSSGQKADITVKNKSTGEVIKEWNNVEFPVSKFSYYAIGYYDKPDYGSDFAPIRVDNMVIQDSSSDVPTCENGTSQDELDAAYERGRQACITDPASCGISISDESCPECNTAASYDVWSSVLSIPDVRVGGDSYNVKIQGPFDIINVSPNN